MATKDKKDKSDDLTPKVRKQSKVIKYEWALNPMKLGMATTYVDNHNSGLSDEARHDAIKARYIELKGRLPGEKRFKDGMHDTGIPRPTSEQAIWYDEGADPLAKGEDVDDDDEEDVDELIEETK